MKNLRLALAFAVLMATLFVGQVSASASPSAAAASACGKTYTVVGGDTLTSIASKCGTTISDILYYNPAITNMNLIYVGQVINLLGTTSVPTTTGTSTPTTSYSGSSYITISATQVSAGTSIVVKAFQFPKNASIDFRLYQKGSSTWKTVYDGTTDSTGYAKQSVTIPASAANGSTWVIKVMTTDRTPVVMVVSPTITVGSGTTTGGTSSTTAAVTLNKTSVAAGGTITAYAEGFPKNADVDFCLRKKSATSCAAVYDGATDGSGKASLTLTVPASAVTGEEWVVQVKTTELGTPVKVVSPKFTIK
ncbi:MAG: LysM domain-containing protein [Anaerolineaceae bacterium]